jgi:nucleotide-binding universal stress UspA family protein
MAAETSPAPEHRIVVGVDGSVPSKAALRWALRQAHLTGAAVEAVTAWHFPAVCGYPAPVAYVLDYEELATGVVKDAIAEATDDNGAGRSQFRPAYRASEGHAAAQAAAVANLAAIANTDPITSKCFLCDGAQRGD